ncbi:MAG: hypothetical protein ACRD3S_14425, partial [Terracidiphilus sp.]
MPAEFRLKNISSLVSSGLHAILREIDFWPEANSSHAGESRAPRYSLSRARLTGRLLCLRQHWQRHGVHRRWIVSQLDVQ